MEILWRLVLALLNARSAPKDFMRTRIWNSRCEQFHVHEEGQVCQRNGGGNLDLGFEPLDRDTAPVYVSALQAAGYDSLPKVLHQIAREPVLFLRSIPDIMYGIANIGDDRLILAAWEEVIFRVSQRLELYTSSDRFVLIMFGTLMRISSRCMGTQSPNAESSWILVIRPGGGQVISRDNLSFRSTKEGRISEARNRECTANNRRAENDRIDGFCGSG